MRKCRKHLKDIKTGMYKRTLRYEMVYIVLYITFTSKIVFIENVWQIC